MKAAIDETLPELRGGIAYVLVGVVIPSDETTTNAALANILTERGRTRPFHWHNEGPTARSNVVKCLIELGASAHVCVHFPTGRKKTEDARARNLREIAFRLLADGVTEVLIESRTSKQDSRDQRVILDVLRSSGSPGALAYRWPPKQERFLWLADGICGAVRDFLVGNAELYYNQLQEAGVITDLVYLNEQSGHPNA